MPVNGGRVPSRRRWVIAASLLTLISLAAAALLTLREPNQHRGGSNYAQLVRALQTARLAAMPALASDPRWEVVENQFAMSYAVCFTASQEDIETFLNSSPALHGCTPELLSPSHQYIPYSETVGNVASLERHAFFHPVHEFPWFNPTVRNNGRRFKVPQDARAIHGEVVVNDETNTVFILMSRS